LSENLKQRDSLEDLAYMGRLYHIFCNTVQTIFFKKETEIGGVWLVCDEVGIGVHFIYDAYMLRLVVMHGLFVTS